MKKKVLITGGTGFVCMNIAQTLLEKGHDVVLFARHRIDDEAQREFDMLPGKVSYFKGDVTNKQSICDAMNMYQISDVIHGAAITPSREAEMENPELVMYVNCLGVLNSLEATRAAGIEGRFIYLGSISGYGQTCFDEKELVEGESLGNPHSLYELSKFTGERLVQRYRDMYGMDAVLARVGDVFGPWERKTGVRNYMSFPYQLTSAAMKGEKVILPKPNCIDWVYGKDIAYSIYALLMQDDLKYDAYPLCSGYIWPLTKWCEKLQTVYPGFQWSMKKEGEKATMCVNQIDDNAPMRTDRLIEQTGYHPQYDLDRAFKDYMNWIETHKRYLN